MQLWVPHTLLTSDSPGVWLDQNVGLREFCHILFFVADRDIRVILFFVAAGGIRVTQTHVFFFLCFMGGGVINNFRYIQTDSQTTDIILCRCFIFLLF